MSSCFLEDLCCDGSFGGWEFIVVEIYREIGGEGKRARCLGVGRLRDLGYCSRR